MVKPAAQIAQVAQSVEQWTENPCEPTRAAGSKLSESDVVRIRHLRADGQGITALASQFGVCSSMVSQICTGRLWRSAGGPLTRKLRDWSRPLEERLREQIDVRGPGECWPWLGGVDEGGYGIFYANGKNLVASRVVLSLKLGRELRADEVTRHFVCDNPPCCNGAHLLPGTRQDNADDAVSHGRQARGETGAHKLTEAQAVDVIARARRGNHSALAREFGVTARAISLIAAGQRWKHLAPGALAPSVTP